MYRVPPPSLHHTIQRWGYFLSQAPLKPFITLNGSDDCNLINRFYLRTLDIYGFCLYHRPPSPVHKRPEAIPQLNAVYDQDRGHHWLPADGVSFSVTWRKKNLETSVVFLNPSQLEFASRILSAQEHTNKNLVNFKCHRLLRKKASEILLDQSQAR